MTDGCICLCVFFFSFLRLGRPLGDPKSINARLDAVEELMKRSDLRDLLETSLKKLPGMYSKKKRK